MSKEEVYRILEVRVPSNNFDDVRLWGDSQSKIWQDRNTFQACAGELEDITENSSVLICSSGGDTEIHFCDVHTWRPPSSNCEYAYFFDRSTVKYSPAKKQIKIEDRHIKVAHNTETGYVGTSEADDEDWKYALERLTAELNKKIR